MEVRDLNVKFIRSLLINEINEYYGKYEEFQLQKDMVNFIRNLLDMLEDQTYLKSNVHILTSDYETIMKNIAKFYLLLPKIFDYDEEKTRGICKIIFESARICLAWDNNKKVMTFSEYREAKKELLSVLNIIRDKYQEERAKYVSKRPIHSESVIDQYKDIEYNLRSWNIINSYQYETLINLFKEKGIDEKERIILLERIKQHNIIAHKKGNNERFSFQKSYEIIDMITSGYELIEVPSIESQRKNEINDFCDILYDQRNSISIDDIMRYLPHYEGNLIFSGNYTKEEFDYFIFNLLKKLQDNMFFNANEIKHQDMYHEKDIRDLIREDYYNDLKIYNMVRAFYDEGIKQYESEEIDEELPDVNNLSFTSRGTENEKTYFESDLKKVPNDLYGIILKHLKYFKKGKIPSTYLKQLTLGTGIYEIKDDQIRIVYKHIGDNNYVILGVFIKKVDNDRQMYDKFVNRSTNNLLSGSTIEASLFELLDAKKHHGGRTNS